MHAGRQQREWDDIAALDARWAVLSDREGKYGGWDERAFFETGEREVEATLAVARRIGRPRGWEHVLDFGCGVGRAAAPLARRFARYTGVDISPEMVERAQAAHAGVSGCEFAVNAAPDLSRFPDASFDMVYSNIVLQHQASTAAIERYLTEFLRVARPGGLVAFQLPSSLPLLLRLQPRRTLWTLLRRLGLGADRLYWRLGLHPMRMRALPRERVTAVLEAHGGRVLEVETSTDPGFGFESSTYYVAND
jgi:SAM-dependent methyltransferase